MYKVLFVCFILLSSAACKGDRTSPVSDTPSTAAESAGEPIPTEPIPIGSGGLVPKTDDTTPLDTDNLYVDEASGFQFLYPDGYIIADKGTTDVGSFVSLMRQDDFGVPEPPLIFISAYQNPEQLPLKAFREQMVGLSITDEKPDTTVAGQPALDFESAGLYENRDLLFARSSKDTIIHVSTTYLNPDGSEDDPIWQAAKSIVSSWQWKGS